MSIASQLKRRSLAYRSGLTTAVAFPISSSLFSGLSFSFSTSSPHPLSPHAILNPAAALHLSLDNAKLSISTKIAVLRRLLLGEVGEYSELTQAMESVAKGEMRLVVQVSKADVMAALVRLKKEVAPQMRMTFLGGHEAWMVSSSSIFPTRHPLCNPQYFSCRSRFFFCCSTLSSRIPFDPLSSKS